MRQKKILKVEKSKDYFKKKGELKVNLNGWVSSSINIFFNGKKEEITQY